MAFLAKYGTKPKHLLHIGAHLLEEFETYESMGITNVSWVEANTKLEPVNSKKFPNARVLYRAVTDVDDSTIILNLTTNSVSSSIFHIDPTSSFSQVIESESIEVHTASLDSVYSWACDSANQAVDCILVDVQGAEGLILKGHCRALYQIHALVIEVSHQTFYLGADEYSNIKYMLKSAGLRKVTSFINPLTGHGDELWFSNKIDSKLFLKLTLFGKFREVLLFLTRSYDILILSKKHKKV